MSKEAEWIQIGKAAKYLGVSRDTLRRWEKKGKITVVRSPSNRRYYTKKQLDQLMKDKSESQEKKGKKSSRKESPKPKASRQLTAIITGVVSFAVAVLIALLLQFFVLR